MARRHQPQNHPQNPAFQNRGFYQPQPQQPFIQPILCKKYNAGECQSQSPHPTPEGLARHCCSHCSRTVNRLYPHPEKYCRRIPGNVNVQPQVPQTQNPQPSKN
jgi:hypothetical protein